MVAYRNDWGGLFLSACRWLSANWAAKPATSVEISAVPAAVPEAPFAPAAAVTQFGLASRLGAIARHNVPVSRPAIKVKNSRHPVPVARRSAVKTYKDTRLPTAVAVNMLSKPARASADIISLDAARRSRSQRHQRIAA